MGEVNLIWHAIQQKDVVIADYRTAAQITGSIDAIARKCGAEIDTYDDPGIGPVRAIYLKRAEPEAYCLVLNYKWAGNGEGTYIEINLVNQLTNPAVSISRKDLNEVMAYIGVGLSDIEWISELVDG